MSAVSEWIGMDVLTTGFAAVHWWRLRRNDVRGAMASSIVVAACGFVGFCSLLAGWLRSWLLCPLLIAAYVAVLRAANR